MSDTASRLRDMEEHGTKHDTITLAGQTSVSQDPRFDGYFAAAITGVLAHRRSDSHSDAELVDQAYNIATLAVKKRRGL